MMIEGKRVYDEIDDRKFINFDAWTLGYESEGPALAALALEIAEHVSQAINNTLEHSPPWMSVLVSEDGRDLTLEIGLGLAKGEWGPAWQFSMRAIIDKIVDENEWREFNELEDKLSVLNILLNNLTDQHDKLSKYIEHRRMHPKYIGDPGFKAEGGDTDGR